MANVEREQELLTPLEKRLDQRAQIQPTHGIHGIFPAALLTEAAQPPIFIGTQGRCNTGLTHCLGYLELLLHRVGPPRRGTPRCYACLSKAARRACITLSRCQLSVTSRSTEAMPST